MSAAAVVVLVVVAALAALIAAASASRKGLVQLRDRCTGARARADSLRRCRQELSARLAEPPRDGQGQDPQAQDALRRQLEDASEQLGYALQSYNDCVDAYNEALGRFPGKAVAGLSRPALAPLERAELPAEF